MLFILLVLAYIAIHITPVQNWIVKKVAKYFSEELHTKVTVKHVDFGLFDKMLIEGILVEDQHQDTLLYAGTMKVNITDWFFFKEKATLHYVGLKDGVVNMNRTDSVWNYQFLIDYFSSPKKTNASKKTRLQYDFKKLELENIRFNQLDKWAGKDMIVAVKNALIDADVISFEKKQIIINSINLDGPVFSQFVYGGNKPKLDFVNTPFQIPVISQSKAGDAGWIMNVKEFVLSNGAFINERQTDRPAYTDRFDGQHLFFNNINGSFKDISFRNDSVTAIVSLSAKEKNGFEINKLQANLKFTPHEMEFGNLDLVTGKSHLSNYLVMRYEDFDDDMSNFLHNVTLEGNFVNSELSSDDLAFFAPALKTWNRSFSISGNAKGTIDNFSAKKMIIKSGNTSVDGDIALRGLPDIKNTFIDFTSNDLQTNYADLVAIVPSLRNVTQPQISRLGNIHYKGNFTGFINDFVAFGTINTNLGAVTSDLNMKLLDNKPPLYSGKISTASFNLGQFLGNHLLGNTSLSGKITGSGFNLKDVKANFDGKINQLVFSGYNYQNITVKGGLEKKLFKGYVSIDDPNLKIDNLLGTINFNEKIPEFKVEAGLAHGDFKKLRLTNDDFLLAGHFDVNFSGSTIDNFSGSAVITNGILSHDGKPLSFDGLNLSSTVVNGKKLLSFSTNEFEGNVNGNFSIEELPDAFNLLLNRYYPTYFKKPTRLLSNQDFTFLVKTKNVDEYIQLLDKRLKGFDNSSISGHLKIPNDELSLLADVPQFSYDGKTFNNIHLESKGSIDSLMTSISVSDIGLSDSFHFPQTDLKLLTKYGVTDFRLKTSASKTLGNAELNASVKTLSDGVSIHFYPSSFIINEKKWTLEKDGELSVRKSVIDASEIKFLQGNQEIVISTEMDKVTGSTNVVARLKKIELDGFMPFLVKDQRMEGQLTGTLVLQDPFGKQKISFKGQAENFVLQNKPVGKIDFSSEADLNTGLIKFKGTGKDSANEFAFDGSYNLKDTTDNRLAVNFTSERFNINTLEPYLGTIFSNMQGNAKSDLKVTAGKITGSVTITEGAMKVIYTQCKYKFNNETILFNPDEIDIGTIQLKDTLGNSGTAGGKMYHHFFKDFEFDNVHFETNRMLLLNTTKRDNPDFYGKVIGSGQMSLNGPVSNLKMNIKGGPSLLASDGSHIYLPSSSSKEIGTIDYIDFIQFGSVMENELRSKEGTNITVDMELTANPACKIDVILDESTGDIIKGEGYGRLNIHAGSKEPLTMRGRYDITKGEYSFNFQTFIKKYFDIKSGYIIWDKDPYEARINIIAEYKATNVDLSSLATSRGKFNQKADVSVLAHLTNTLKNPKINFEFNLPAESDYKKDPIVLESLKKFTQDENEMNRQVASLLLFNSFISDNNGGFRGSTASFLSGTAGQVISNFLNNQFAKFFQKVFNDPTITPYLSLNSNYDVTTTSPELLKALQASGNFGLKKQYLNGRLIVSLGGNVDYNNPYILAARNTNILLTPDITIEYFLTPDGKLRIVGFNRTSVDLALGQRNRTGVSLSYSKDFNKLSELFAPSEERKRRRAERKAKKQQASN